MMNSSVTIFNVARTMPALAGLHPSHNCLKSWVSCKLPDQRTGPFGGDCPQPPDLPPAFIPRSRFVAICTHHILAICA
jgi:hypothetical protein